jgi:hypothetical protein
MEKKIQKMSENTYPALTLTQILKLKNGLANKIVYLNYEGYVGT